MNPIIDFRHLDAPKPSPEFQPADPMDIQNAREYITRLRLERYAEGFRRERETDGRQP